jgi:pSer/pThr/pTyr-binding forkhead associated (FHA) protein
VLEVNGTRHPVVDRVVVGRGTEADLRINDPGVSRRHAELRLEGNGALVVEDLGSTNGTLVDGERVEHRRLEDGATVRVGHTDLVVRIGTV